MKAILIILLFVVSSECGLIDDLVISKEKPESLKDLFTQKPKSATESNVTENHQGVLVKVRETLVNGTKIVIDALGNVIRIHPNKENKENSKTKNNLESTTIKSSEEPAVVKKEEESKLTNQTELAANNASDKVQVASINITKNQEQTASKIDDQTPDANGNKTLPTEANTDNTETKDIASNVNDIAQNTTETRNEDTKNCTTAENKPCGNTKVISRTSLKADDCVPGKSRADDNTCVDEV